VIGNYITVLLWRTKGRSVNIFFNDVNAEKVNFIGINDLLCGKNITRLTSERSKTNYKKSFFARRTRAIYIKTFWFSGELKRYALCNQCTYMDVSGHGCDYYVFYETKNKKPTYQNGVMVTILKNYRVGAYYTIILWYYYNYILHVIASWTGLDATHKPAVPTVVNLQVPAVHRVYYIMRHFRDIETSWYPTRA